MKKKLVFKKVFISNLQDYEMKEVKGQSVFVSGCVACLTEKPECTTELICHTKAPCEN